MRTQWLKENKRLVSQDNFGNDLAAVEAAMKKHEAIESDIYVSYVLSHVRKLRLKCGLRANYIISARLKCIPEVYNFLVYLQAYEARINTCVALSEELNKEEYHDVQRILVKYVKTNTLIQSQST